MRRVIQVIMVLVVLKAAQACNRATALQAGLNAYSRGDYQTALAEWTPLAERGYADGQSDLGGMYHDGIGVAQDYGQALNWYRKAADQGNSRAQFNLGVMYENRQGVAQDYGQAVKWYRKAADQADVTARRNLALMYRDGKGVPQDFVQADIWLILAAAQGGDNIPKLRDGLKQRMTPEQVAEAEARAAAWQPKQNEN